MSRKVETIQEAIDWLTKLAESLPHGKSTAVSLVDDDVIDTFILHVEGADTVER